MLIDCDIESQSIKKGDLKDELKLILAHPLKTLFTNFAPDSYREYDKICWERLAMHFYKKNLNNDRIFN